MKNALEKRRRQSATIGRLMVSAFMAMRSGYDRKNISAVFEELLVGMLIRVSDDAGKPPLTPSDISKHLSLPRSNVRRCVNALLGQGVIVKEGTGYRGTLDWLAARIEAEWFLKICDAIITAADELKALEEESTP
jgi:hypothetical protein